MRPISRLIAVVAATGLIAATTAITAGAAVVQGSSASAFGVKAHAVLLGQGGLDVPATPYVAVPEADDTPNEATRTIVGPLRIPSDTGQLISDIRGLHTEASRTNGNNPTAHAESQVSHVALLSQAGQSLIEADALHAVADVKCSNGKSTTSADGSRFSYLRIGDQEIDVTPEPNTEIPLVYVGDPANPADDMGVRVIINEQTGANSGNGIIVTMLHIIAYSPTTPNLVFADVRIASAKATAFCGRDSEPTNDNPDDRDLVSDKVATSTTSDPQGALGVNGVATAFRGDEVTWTITISNAGAGCRIVRVIDTLPPYFTFVKSAGDLTSTGAPVQDGQTLTWTNNAQWPLPENGKLVETITAKVAADAPYGTYTDLVDIDESTCGTFTQGDGGPVDVIPRPAAVKPRVLGRSATLPSTGVNASAPIAMSLLLIGLGMVARVASRRTA